MKHTTMTRGNLDTPSPLSQLIKTSLCQTISSLIFSTGPTFAHSPHTEHNKTYRWGKTVKRFSHGPGCSFENLHTWNSNFLSLTNSKFKWSFQPSWRGLLSRWDLPAHNIMCQVKHSRPGNLDALSLRLATRCEWSSEC